MTQEGSRPGLAEYLTVAEAAAYLGVSPSTLRNWDRAGKLKPERHPANGYRIYRTTTLREVLEAGRFRGRQPRVFPPAVDWNEIGETEHFVMFYETDAFLLESLSRFIAPTLLAGEVALVIATPEHRAGLEQILADQGIDVVSAVQQGQFVAVDARDMLSGFMRNGFPDAQLFADVVGSAIARIAQKGRVRAFGEMVALLWQDGRREAACRLEELWNELGQSQSFALFCAYPLRCFGSEADGASFHRVCRCHSRVIPAEGYTKLSDPQERLMAIGVLQQKAAALQAEVAQRIHAEQELRDFVENALEGLHKVGPDGKIIWANRAELEMLGYRPEEYIGRHIANFHVDQQVIEGLLHRLMRGESVYNCSARLLCRDGSIKDVLIHANGCYEQGKLVYTRCFSRDITDRKRAEERLRESEQRLAIELAATQRLQAISTLMIQEGNAESLYQQIVEAAATIMRTDMASMQIVDDGENALRLLAFRGFEPQFGQVFAWNRFGTPTSCSVARQTGRRVVVEDVETCEFMAGSPALDDLRKLGVRAVQSTPLCSRSGVLLGTIATHWRQPHLPSERDLRLLDVLARQAADLIERARADHALRESQERFRRLVGLLPAGVYTCDAPHGVITFYNERAAELWGQSPQFGDTDQRFCGSFRLWWPDGTLLPHDQTPMAQALRHGRSFQNEEVVIERPDGTRITVLVNIEPVRNEQGRLVGAVNVFHDTTALKQAEQELRRRTAQFETLLNKAPLGVYLVDADFRIREVNPVALPVFGEIPGGVVGQDFETVIRLLWEPSYADEIVRIFRHTLATGESYVTPERAEFRIDRGAIEYYEWRLDRITLPDGRFGVVCYFRDISEQVRARQEIAESERRFRSIADAMPQIVWTARPDGYIDYYNERWYEYTGFPRGEFGQQSWEPILHPDDVQRCVETYFGCIQTEQPYQIEYRFKDRKAGNYRWFMGRALPIRDGQGNVLRWFGTCTDIDDVKRAEEALKEADRRKNEFLATLAHELRNPLAPIRTGLELMKIANGDAQVLDEARNTMERQTLQLITLVDDLLDVSRITRGKFELRPCRVCMSHVVRSAVEASRPYIDEAGHTLSIDVPPQPVLLYADPNRLAQVLSNLLNNAAKYTPAGGQVGLSAERQGTDVVFSVRDNGIGIPEDMRERVFEMFTQIHESMEFSHSGLGIGLTLVKSLVEMHAGSVQVHSDGANRGSTFSVRLPIVIEGENEADVPDAEHCEPAKKLQRIRVLIVDDNVAAADMLSKVVRLLGHEVRTAHDGREALDVASDFRPDVVLMDLGMPNMNGYEAARRIRLAGWGGDVLLIALTGWGQDEDKRRTLEAGFDFHLVKPADPSRLKQLFAHCKAARARGDQ
jgi:PAS domain S-box-containing protein/excisionase family DNA binding protein